MAPVLGWEVIEGQQLVLVFLQTLARFRILGVVFFQEVLECGLGVGFRFCLPDFMNIPLGFRLYALGQLVEHIGRLVNPTALLLRLGKDLSQGGPKTQCTVTHGDLRGDGKPMTC